MPPSPETWNPASLVTAAAGAAAHSRCLAQKDGSEKKTEEDVAKTSLPPAFGASSLDSPLLPRAPLDAPDGARSPATTATALKAAAKAAAAAASRGTFLKGEPPAPSPGERLGDEVARVAGGFLSLATSMLDRVDALRGRAEAAGKAERARTRELWMLSSPQRARGMRETKAHVSQALDACEAELEAAEAEARVDAPSDTRAGGGLTDVREAFSDASSSDASSDDASDLTSRGSSLGLSDLELSDEEEETRELAAASRSFAEALARESRKSAAAARDARSVAAVAAAIAEAATRGVDICAREVAALAREGGVATERELSEETRDTAYRGFARYAESDATNGEEEEETNESNDALDANALDAKETLNRLVPTGPFKRAVLSAYIPKRRDRRHTRKTTPPKVEKPKNAAAAPRAPPPARSGDLFADFAFAGTQKKNNL